MRSVRPRDAATLILVRHLDGTPEVLMGRRATRDAWSDQFVFPGGRVDPRDSRVDAASALRPEVEARLAQGCSKARARALAVAAVRETIEETGIALVKPSDSGASTSRQPPWAELAAAKLAPALDELHLLCRAITPPQRPKRFNARFFVADAEHARGELRGNGELGDLRWFTLEQARGLPLPAITQAVLVELRRRLEAPSLETPATTPLFRSVGGRHLKLTE